MNIKLLLISFLLLSCIFKLGISQKFDAEGIKYSTFCEISKDKYTITDSAIIQINNRFGEKYTEVEIPYSQLVKVSNIDAWIENMDGTKVRSLEKSEIIDRNAISKPDFYSNSFIKCFQLKHNVYPYKVIYTYKTTQNNFFYLGWNPLINKDIPTRVAILKVKVPKNFPLNKFISTISDFKLDSIARNLAFEWKTSYEKPLKLEIFSQPNLSIPMVLITALNFNSGVEGSTKDWVSYGNWYFRLMEGCDDLPEFEKKTVSELIKGVSDSKEIVKILYHYLQDHTRYIRVQMDLGGFKPYPASYVSQNKYGDSKALTIYLKALLSCARIESLCAFVYSDGQPNYFFKNIAAPQFNHIILAVPLTNDTIWLDNVESTIPFGYIGTFIQNREALLISEKNSRLVRIPQIKKEETLVSLKISYNLNLTTNSDLILKGSFKGRDFEYFNSLNSDYNVNDRDRIIRNYLPFDNYEVNKWELKKIHRDTALIELYVSLSLSKLLKPIGNEYYFNLNSITVPNFSNTSNRTLPVILPYPINHIDTLVYSLPKGYEMKTELDTVSIKSKYGNFNQILKFVEGKLYAIKSFELYPASYTIEQYPDFYKFIKSVKDVDEKKIIIKPQISNN